MYKYSLKKLILEANTEVQASPGDPYRYERRDDGWYTRHKDWLPSRPWARLDPANPRFKRAILELNAKYPNLAFDVSGSTATSAPAKPKPAVTAPGDVIPSQKFPGDTLRKRQVLALEEIALGKAPAVTPENYLSSGRMLPLYAVQFILGVKQGDFNAETIAALTKFQKDNNLFPREDSIVPDMFRSDDDRLGTIDKLTARALLKISKEASTLGMTTYYGSGDYPVEESETSTDSLKLLKGIETRGFKVNIKQPDLKKLLKTGSTVTVGLCKVDQCAAYVGIVFTQGAFRNDAGDAWTQHRISQVKSGVIKFTPFNNLTDEQIAQITQAFRLACKYGDAKRSHPDLSAIVKNFVPDQQTVVSSIELGDVVGIYNSGSDSFSKAIFHAGKNFFIRPGTTKDTPVEQRVAQNSDMGNAIKWIPGNTLTKNRIGFGMNTHLGVVGAILDGIPIVFHNVHGTILATPVIPGTEYPVMWVKTPQKMINPAPVS